MQGTYEYLLWTNDVAWMNLRWPKYEHAMTFIIAKIDASGVLNVSTGPQDWGRLSQGGRK